MLSQRIRFLFSQASVPRIVRHFIGALGFFWLFVEFFSFFLKDTALFSGQWVFGAILICSLLFALFSTFPRITFEHRSIYSNVSIRLVVGDLFEQSVDLALVTSDYFDTVDENPQQSRSIKAQLIERVFGGDTAKVDQMIEQSIKTQKLNGSINAEKSWGKTSRYRIGSIVPLVSEGQRFHLVVACHVKNDKSIDMSKDDLWSGLSSLWKFVGRETHEIAVPLWGAGLSRAQASRRTLMQTLLLSFALATRERKVASRLTVVIHDKEYDPAEFQDAIRFIKTLDF